MTATRTALEIYLDINIVLVLSLVLWAGLRLAYARGAERHAFAAQLGILKTILALVALSPVLAIGAAALFRSLLPEQSLILSDIAISAFLRGDIAMDAIRFEEVLNTRARWTQDILALASPAAKVVVALVAAGAVLCATRLVLTALCIRRMVAGSHLLKKSRAVEIRVSETVSTPLAISAGFRRYVILPGDLVARPTALRMAVAHELQHLRQRDLQWEIGFEILRPLFFWNPAFILLKLQFDRLRELACDQAVLATERFDRRDYAKCLLEFCRRTRHDRQTPALNVALVSSGRNRAKRDLICRVLALQAHHQPGRALTGRLFLALPVCLFVISLLAASLQPARDWSLDRLMLSTVVNLERLEAINRR